jgi:hypothetical protein
VEFWCKAASFINVSHFGLFEPCVGSGLIATFKPWAAPHGSEAQQPLLGAIRKSVNTTRVTDNNPSSSSGFDFC